MANFTLVADSTFKPFTYQELVTPIAHQQQVMDQLADEYDKLSSQADILEAMGKNDKDKKSGVYSQYQAYSNALREEADNLYRNGLNYDSRMRLSDLRRRYNKEIVPIQNAWNERKQEADTQMKARLQNPSLRFTRDAANSSLEEYINNPMGGYGVVDLKTVTAMMAGMAKNLAKKIKGSKGRLEDIDGTTYDYIRDYGLDANIIGEWERNPDSYPTLTKMLNQVLAANGLTSDAVLNSPNGESLLTEATNAAKMGAWEAIGEEKGQVTENWSKRKAIEHSYAVDMENRRHAHAIAEKQAPNYSDLHPTGDGADSGFPFSGSNYELPMMGADFNGQKENAKALEALGFSVGKDGVYHQGTISTKDYGKVPNMVKTGRGHQQVYRGMKDGEKDITVSFFNKDGSVKTRKEFYAQWSDPKAAEKYGKELFDRALKANKTLGLSGIYKSSDAARAYKTLRDNSAAKMLDVIPLNYDKGTWNSTAKGFIAQEIIGYKEGKPIYSPQQVSLNSLLERSDGTGNINVASFWSSEKGNEGLILATNEDGKNRRYFIPVTSMPDFYVKGARDAFEAADYADKMGMTQRAKDLRNTAMRSLHQGLTLNNLPQNQSINRQLSLDKQLKVE